MGKCDMEMFVIAPSPSALTDLNPPKDSLDRKFMLENVALHLLCLLCLALPAASFEAPGTPGGWYSWHLSLNLSFSFDFETTLWKATMRCVTKAFISQPGPPRAHSLRCPHERERLGSRTPNLLRSRGVDPAVLENMIIQFQQTITVGFIVFSWGSVRV